MDMSGYHLTATISIAAPPEKVWDTISDITRMGEFSPVCTGGEWDEGITEAAEGAWFTGHNTSPERSWSTRCTIEVAERGKAFGFLNHGTDGQIPLVRWRYDLTPVGNGTDVTETWQVLDGYETFLHQRAPGLDVEQLLNSAKANTGPGMENTLAALKRTCEG